MKKSQKKLKKAHTPSKHRTSKKVAAVKAKHSPPESTGNVGVPEKKRPSKAQIVRELPLSMSAKEVIAHAKREGVQLQESYVYNVRTAMKMKKTSTYGLLNPNNGASVTIGAWGHGGGGGGNGASRQSRAEELLVSVASEVGLPRALEVLEGMRAPLSEFLAPLLG